MSAQVRLGGASFQRRSANDKFSVVLKKKHPNGRYQTFPQAPYVSSTYVSIEATCPDTCTFKDNGCFVQSGGTRGPAARLDDEARTTDTTVNAAEATLIDLQWSSKHGPSKGRIPQVGARGGPELRLHVGGDVANWVGAVALGTAADRWQARGGGDVWTYTHRWYEMGSWNFGPSISVLASVETISDAHHAIAQGYTPAFTTPKFLSDKAFKIPEDPSLTIIPCPAETRGVKCNQCRLCFKPLPKGKMIGFQVHGPGSKKAAAGLPIMGQAAAE